MDIVAQIILFTAIVVLAANALLALFSSYELKTAIQRRLNIDEYANKQKNNLVERILDLFIPINYVLVNRFFKREELEGKMFAARVFIIPEHFLAIKELLAIAFLFLTFLFMRKGDVLPLFVFPVVGFISPDVWLTIKLNKRRNDIVKTLPDVVDLLSLCVDAGLDFMAASKWIVEKSNPNAFIEEMSLVLHEIKVGKSRRDALSDMAKRIKLPDVTAFCRTLTQADKMGIPIAQALSVLSEDVRERYFRRAERLALQAPMKMLIPLIFFILPVVAVIVGGPVLLQFMGGTGLGTLK